MEQKEIPQRKVLSLMTVASPNRGSRLADICVNMPETNRGSTRVLNAFGYNIASKRHFFEQLTHKSVNELLPVREITSSFTRHASIVCHSPRSEWCTPLKLFYNIKAFKDFDLPSDGVVERDTQPYGDVIAELNIDHFRQVGMFGERPRFVRLCDILADFFIQTQKQN